MRISVTVSFKAVERLDPVQYGLEPFIVTFDTVRLTGSPQMLTQWATDSGDSLLLRRVQNPPPDPDVAYLDQYTRPAESGDCAVWYGPHTIRAKTTGIAPMRNLVTPFQLVWLKFKEGEPLPKRITHTCRTPFCVNPAHLEGKSPRR